MICTYTTFLGALQCIGIKLGIALTFLGILGTFIYFVNKIGDKKWGYYC